MVDMSKTIAPKSDQLNYDDLISGPITIKITGVRGNESPEQPVSIFFEGDNGKPYKPCKSMRRILVAVWGPDAAQYQGRALRLFGDPKVKFGGMEVGGIRISHMSHIDRAIMVPITVSKARRSPYKIDPLSTDQMPAGGGANNGGAGGGAPDIDMKALSVRAESSANGGTDIYKEFFEGLNRAEQIALKENTTADPNDFNQQKPIHEVCKAIAMAEDARKADQNKGDPNEY